MVLHAVLYSTHCVWFSLTAHYMQLCGSCHKFVTPLMSKVKNLELISENLANLDYKVLEATINGEALKSFHPEEIIPEIFQEP